MDKNDVAEVLISEAELKEICSRLGKQISKDYEGKNLLLVSVLKGAVVFMSDLLREITCDCRIDFMAVSSYSVTEKKRCLSSQTKSLNTTALISSDSIAI